MTETPDRAAIVGGGPAGLAMGRALARFGVDFEIIEQNADFGGLWNRDWDKSPIYDSAHFISSRTMSAFEGYPMPADWPDYPRHDLILDYVRGFAREFGLYDHARFGVAVESAGPDERGWTLRFSDGGEARYRWLVCANGATWDAAAPELPGAFTGRIRHARDYDGADELAGRRVLVVGCGNSGADIACDAAQRADFAGLSLRRGYWFIPKFFQGLPTDVYAARQPPAPLWLRQRVLKRRLRKITGDLTRYGVPAPDHELLETHPLMNDQVVHYIRHGDLTVYPSVERLAGDEVVFTDGRRAAFDEIILATGYHWSAPFLPDAVNPFAKGKVQIPLCIFSPARDDLFFISFIKAAGSSITLFSEMAWIIARAIAGQAAGGDEAARLKAVLATERFDLKGGLRVVNSERHAAYVERDAFARALKRLRRRMGWPATEQAA